MADRTWRPVAGRAGRSPGTVAVLTVGLLVGLVVGLAVGIVGAPSAAALAPRQTTQTGTSSVAPVPGGPGGRAAAADPPATAPQPTGQALPSRAQRLGDSLVAGWVLLLLTGGLVVAAVWSRRSIAQR